MITFQQIADDLVKKLRAENPQITEDQVMAEIVKMRKEKGWDAPPNK